MRMIETIIVLITISLLTCIFVNKLENNKHLKQVKQIKQEVKTITQMIEEIKTETTIDNIILNNEIKEVDLYE